MKLQRRISGIFFRYQNPETNRWENWVFEDLPEEKQDEIMNEKGIEWVKHLAKLLANTVNNISEQYDITCNPDHLALNREEQ